jgi:hypothetical protein
MRSLRLTGSADRPGCRDRDAVRTGRPVDRSQARRAAKTKPYQSRHYAVVRWLLDNLHDGAERSYGLHVQIEEPELSGEELAARPVVVLSRHAGPGDSFLLIHRLLTAECVHPAGRDRGTSSPARSKQLAQGAGRPRRTDYLPRRRQLDTRPLAARHPSARDPGTGPATRARTMPNLLPPRPGGTLAAITACPDADVIFVAHSGLDSIKARWWRVPYDQVPREAAFEAQVKWLYDWWQLIDAWITANRPEGAAGPRPPTKSWPHSPTTSSRSQKASPETSKN